MSDRRELIMRMGFAHAKAAAMPAGREALA